MASPDDAPWDVAVIGAGACGLTVARGLAAAGRSVILLDKGSRPGGRLACRRVGDVVVDTGATGVDTDDDLVIDELGRHCGAAFDASGDGARHWSFDRPANEVAARWLGGTTLRHALVTHLERGGDGTLAVCANASAEPVAAQQAVVARQPVAAQQAVVARQPVLARQVVLTAPAPQSRAILERSGLAANGVLASISYDPAILLAAALDTALPPDGVEPDPSSPIASLRATGWGSSTPRVVATTRTDWATASLDGEQSELTAELLLHLHRLVPDVRVVAHDLKVWRYAHAAGTVAGDRFVHCEDEPSVLVAGDGFGPPGDRRSGIPRAVRSGLAVAAVCS